MQYRPDVKGIVSRRAALSLHSSGRDARRHVTNAVRFPPAEWEDSSRCVCHCALNMESFLSLQKKCVFKRMGFEI